MFCVIGIITSEFDYLVTFAQMLQRYRQMDVTSFQSKQMHYFQKVTVLILLCFAMYVYEVRS
jgi:hypothetical protein